MKLPRRSSHRSAASRQRGVVLLFTLIALAILLIGAIALIRSFNTSLFTAGNVAFKRDLANQAERAVPLVMDRLRTGALHTPATRAADTPALNYSAAMLPVNAQGIPQALLANDATFQAAWTAADITVTDAAGRNQQVTLRYLVDRLCATAGDETALGDQCIRGADTVRGGSTLQQQAVDTAAPQPVVYRLSVRVTGPRGTQAFVQTTFSL